MYVSMSKDKEAKQLEKRKTIFEQYHKSLLLMLQQLLKESIKILYQQAAGTEIKTQKNIKNGLKIVDNLNNINIENWHVFTFPFCITQLCLQTYYV